MQIVIVIVIVIVISQLSSRPLPSKDFIIFPMPRAPPAH